MRLRNNGFLRIIGKEMGGNEILMAASEILQFEMRRVINICF